MNYTKLSELIDKQFTIQEAHGYTWKKWDKDANRMLTSEHYQEGFSKKYTIITDKGSLDLGSGQLGSLLEAVYRKGIADINNQTYGVKSNGKSGMDIRYYFNLMRDEPKPKPHDEDDQAVDDYVGVTKREMDEPVNLDEIPF